MSPTTWEQYEQLVGFYRFYLELAVKTSTAFWLITGGVLTLVLANSDQDHVIWALSIPIVMSIGLISALLKGRPMAIELSDSIRDLSIELRVRQRVHAEILVWTVQGLLLAASAAALVLLLVLVVSVQG
jgi:hypothetical protein